MPTFELPSPVKNILKTFHNAKFEIWLVGGCVRDLLMGRPVKDWDFSTIATPEEILTLYPHGFYNNAFGTVGVPVKNREWRVESGDEEKYEIFEITTYRTEHGYSDKRHPDKILWGKTIEEDLSRRDFTTNAIAYNGETMVDPFDGQGDIKNRLIRAVGDPTKRFEEDALRMMRAVRIATELAFIIETETFSAIKKNVQRIQHISGERVRDELFKILSSPYPADGVMILKNSGLLGQILPELDRCFDIQQLSPRRHHIYDVGTHLVKSLEYAPTKDPLVRLATLLHDIGKFDTYYKTPEGVITFYNHEIVSAALTREIVDRLRLSRDQRERVIRLVRWHQFTVDERQTDSAIRRFIRNVGKENLEDMLALRIGDRLGGGARETSWRLDLFRKRLTEVQVQPFSIQDLKVNGYDVMKTLDIKPGPQVGKILEALFKEVEEDKEKNNRDYLLKRIPEVFTLQGDTLQD